MLGTEPQIRENYVKTGQVKLIFHPILDLGSGSMLAGQAAECAGEQGQFWAMHDVLFKEQGKLYGSDVNDVIKELADQLPLDKAKFTACLDEQRYAQKIQQLDARRRELGIRTRPTIDVNGQLVIGAQPFGVFQQVIEPLLGQ